MDHKQYQPVPFELLEVKAGTEGWQFTGKLSTFGNVDDGGDVVHAGAFDRTLRERDFRPLLWSHRTGDLPIGVEQALRPEGKALVGTWDLLDTQLGTDVYKALKKNALRKMSMGYFVYPGGAEIDDKGVRHLREVDLIEASVVNLPMNEQADITRVKSAIQEPFDQFLRREAERYRRTLSELKDLYSRRAAEFRLPSEGVQTAEVAYLAEAKAFWDEVADIKATVREAQDARRLAETVQQAKAADGLTLTLRLARTRSRLREQGILTPAAASRTNP